VSRLRSTPSRFARLLFAIGLSLYPRDFRQSHGRALLDTYVDQLNAAHRTRGWWGRWHTMIAEWMNLVGNASRLRLTRHAKQRTPRRDENSVELLRSIMQDVQFALRTFARQPGFVVTTLTILAVGIAANTTIFSLVNAYLLRPLPFPDSDRLVSVSMVSPDAPMSVWRTIPSTVWETEWPRHDDVIEQLVAWDLDGFTLVGAEGTEAVTGAWITPGYFAAIGARPHLGRLLTEADARPGAAPVAVIEYGLWLRRFGGDSSEIGKSIQAYAGDRPDEAEAFTIVGVLPEDFWFVNRATEILTVLRGPRPPSLVLVREGVSIDRVVAHLTAIVKSQVAGLPENWQVDVRPTHEAYVDSVRPILIALGGAVGLVLLLGCANVAMLLLVRAVGRERELGVRRALGASRGRIARQLLTEGLMLATLAGAIGVTLAAVALQLLAPIVQQQLRTAIPGGVERLNVDAPVLLMAVGISTVTGVLFAVIPALTASGGEFTRALGEGGRGAGDSKRRHLIRNVLIGAEIAMSLTLLIGATLMIRSALHLQSLDLGFVPDNVVTANITLRERSYPEAEQRRIFVDRLEAAARATPGVEAASVFAHWPFQGAMTEPVATESDDPTRTAGLEAARYVVGDDYFEVLHIPLLRGRSFERADNEGSEPVVIIGESLARRVWPGQDPIGRRMRFGTKPGGQWRTVVGVVGDVRETLTDDPIPDSYVPYHQEPRLFLFVALRTTTPRSSTLNALRTLVANIDPTAAVTRVATMDELVARESARPRFMARLLTAFGGFAVAIALFGLYSLVAYSVGQRRHEVAVRMALGARSVDVVGLFLRNGGLVITGGLVIGVLGGLAVMNALTSQLYGVTAHDWSTFVGASVALGAAALGAVWLSASRAADTHPSAVLRQD
jgi:putative ABC transport system permease protein